MKRLLAIVFCCVMLFMLVSCGSKTNEGIQMGEGTETLSSFFNEGEKLVYFIWDETIYDINQLNGDAKVDVSSDLLHIKDGTCARLNTSSALDEHDDMTLKKLLLFPQEEILNCFKEEGKYYTKYLLTGFTDSEGSLYQEDIWIQLGEDSYKPYSFQNQVKLNIEGEHYVGFYKIDDRGLQACVTKCDEDIELVFDNKRELLLNPTTDDILDNL